MLLYLQNLKYTDTVKKKTHSFYIIEIVNRNEVGSKSEPISTHAILLAKTKANTSKLLGAADGGGARGPAWLSP